MINNATRDSLMRTLERVGLFGAGVGCTLFMGAWWVNESDIDLTEAQEEGVDHVFTFGLALAGVSGAFCALLSRYKFSETLVEYDCEDEDVPLVNNNELSMMGLKKRH